MTSNSAPTGPVDPQKYKETIRSAARDETLVAMRFELARFAAGTVAAAGQELQVLGHIVGPDHVLPPHRGVVTELPSYAR